MIILFNNLLPNDRAHPIPIDISRKLKPITVIDKFIETVVALIKSTVSTDSSFVFRILKVYYIF